MKRGTKMSWREWRQSSWRSAFITRPCLSHLLSVSESLLLTSSIQHLFLAPESMHFMILSVKLNFNELLMDSLLFFNFVWLSCYCIAEMFCCLIQACRLISLVHLLEVNFIMWRLLTTTCAGKASENCIIFKWRINGYSSITGLFNDNPFLTLLKSSITVLWLVFKEFDNAAWT